MDLADIRRLRLQYGLTQTQLAKLSHVSQSLIAKIEAGRMDPTFTKAKRIFDALTHFTRQQEKKAEDVMNTNVLFAHVGDRVLDVVSTLRKQGISQLPVKERDRVVGLISEGAILDAMAHGSVDQVRVRDILEPTPPTIPHDAPLPAAMELLRFYPLLLVQRKGAHVGIVTKADVFTAL